MARRVGIIGFGHLGQFLTERVQESPDHELAFVWNRSPEKIREGLPVLEDLADAASMTPDLIVEVAHPVVAKRHLASLLGVCDVMAGSPTAFADADTEAAGRAACTEHGLYVAKGALPGLHDVREMVANGKLHGARIRMTKPPHSLRYSGPVDLDAITEETMIYDGPVRQLAGWAPNNVNTMCVLAMASELGFDDVKAELVVIPDFGFHLVEVELCGPPRADGKQFKLELKRTNPAAIGAVTGTATYQSFWRSLQRAEGMGPGVHFV